MALPVALQQAIDQAHEAMTAHPQHELTPFQRARLYELIGPINKLQSWRVRAWIDMFTAHRVLPQWERLWPDNSMAQDMLALAENTVRGITNPEAAGRMADDTGRELNELCSFEDGEEINSTRNAACAACEATIRAVFTASGHDPFMDLEIEEHETNDGIDPWHSDAAGWAVLAYTGCPYGELPDPNRQLDFWEWWLHEAIPAAWQAAQ